jgi:hypothetical protein
VRTVAFVLAALAASSCGDDGSATTPTGEVGSDQSTHPAAEPGPGGGTQTTAGYQKVDADVVDLVRSGRDVPVIVSLAEPEVAEGDPGAMQEAVDAAQQRVLAELQAEEFTTRLAFENVPALAGTVRAESALATLDRHPDVVRVTLDGGGGGGGGGGS